jgi:hypothetical protein
MTCGATGWLFSPNRVPGWRPGVRGQASRTAGGSVEEIGGAGFKHLFETDVQACFGMALITDTPILSTLLLPCPPQSPGAWALSLHWSPAAMKALADAVKAGAVGWKSPKILSQGSTAAAMVSDRQARIAEIEEQIDMLDAEARRFLLDGFLGNNTLPVELVEATLDVVALITVGHVDRHDDGGLGFAQRDDTAPH